MLSNSGRSCSGSTREIPCKCRSGSVGSNQNHPGEPVAEYRSKWWTFDEKALSIAARMRPKAGWREISNYLYRSGFPPYDPEVLRLAVLDLRDRPSLGPRTRHQPKPPPRSPNKDVPAGPSRPPPKAPVKVDLPSPEALEKTYQDAWSDQFPGEPWPGIDRAIRILMKKDRGRIR
jgi:hypothetical protein